MARIRPVGAVSLSRGCSTVMRPGRAPRSSGLAFGGCRSPWSSVSSSSSRSSFVVSEENASQSSMRTGASASRFQTAPLARSLSRISPRLTRNTRSVASELSEAVRGSSAPQRVTTAPRPPDQAAYSQAPRRTGSVGRPERPWATAVASPVSRSTSSSSVRVETRTEPAAAPGCWSTEPGGSEAVPPSTTTRSPVSPSRSTPRSPTDVIWRSVPMSTARFSVTGSAKPCPRGAMRSTRSSSAEAASTAPSVVTVRAAAPPTVARGSTPSASGATVARPVSGSNRPAQTRPSSGSRTATDPPAITTSAPGAMMASSPSTACTSAGSMLVTRLSVRLTPMTPAPCWTMSRLSSASANMAPSAWPIGLLTRPKRPSALLVTQMPPSLSSVRCDW